MKSARYIMLFIAVLLTGSALIAQNNVPSSNKAKTVSIKVNGKCESCKARIEKAAQIKGVSKADWNMNSKILTLVYDPAEVSTDDVQRKIAGVGHDTEKYKADDKVYDSLPGCCKYR